MRFLKLPATLRWGLVNCLLLWVMMSVYRLVLTSILAESVTSHLDAIGLGILLDFGAISIPGALYIVFSFIPQLHPYKSKTGMLFGIIFFSIFGFMFALVYGLDLVFIKSFSSRISGLTFVELITNPAEEKVFRRIPYLALFTGVSLMVWIWWKLIEWLLRTLGPIARAEEKVVRLFWQTLTLGIFILAIIQSAGYTASIPGKAIATDENLKVALQVNPVLTLLFK